MPEITSRLSTFEDVNLEAAIGGALSVGAQEDLTCSDISAVSGLTRVTGLILSDNLIGDIGPRDLSGAQ